jgi:hypothetical protein
MSDTQLTSHGKQLRIFLTSGSPVGVHYAELVNWTGQAFSCPKNLFSELKDWPDQIQRPGVYVLVGVGETEPQVAYIGESEDVLRRLVVDHFAKPPQGMVEIVQALLFTSKDDNLTKGHIIFLEEKLQERAKLANRVRLLVGREPSEKKLSRQEEATMKEFLDNIYLVAATLGFSLFELTKKTRVGGKLFLLNLAHGVKAKGYLVEGGFLVESGSHATKETAGSLNDGYKQLRKELIGRNILKREGNKYLFTSDYTFKSSSAAASVVSGSQRSGPAFWKDEKDKTLGHFEANKAKKTETELKKVSSAQASAA